MKLLAFLLCLAPMLPAQTCQILELPPDGPVTGALTESDCSVKDFVKTDNSVNKADAYRVNLRERSILRIRMASTEVDSHLHLLNDRGAVVARDNNSGGDRNAEINMQFPAGSYTIVASVAGSTLGAYQLTVQRSAPRNCRVEPLPTPGDIEADLLDTDCRVMDLQTLISDTTLVDLYRIDIERTGVLTVTMTSTAFDALLSIYDSQGRRIGQDNNSGGGTNAKLTVSLTQGSYLLRAQANRPGAGMYRLNTSVSDRRSCTAIPLPAGETISGELKTSGCRFLDWLVPAMLDFPVDLYRIEVKERSIARLRKRSGLLDPYLLLFDANRRILAENDDIDRTTYDAEIYISLHPGTYTLMALDAWGDIGKYDVALTAEALRKCDPLMVEAPGSAPGSLTADGCRAMDIIAPSINTAPAAALGLKVPSRAWITASLSNTTLQGIIDVGSMEGVSYLVDGPANQIGMLMPAGTYAGVVATRNRGTGDFTLEIGAREPAHCEPAELKPGTPLSGDFAADDCLVREILPFYTPTTRGDLLRVDVNEVGPLVAEIRSQGVPPAVILLDAAMTPLALDLNVTFGSTAKVDWEARPGTYFLLVLSFDSAGGPYSATVDPIVVSASQ